MRKVHYGDDRTIHKTTQVNVELDEQGKVVSVWFRCMALPFTQKVVENTRAEEMRRMYREMETSKIAAVDMIFPDSGT